MALPIIEAQGVGKRFVLHHQQRERYTALRDVLAAKARGLLKGGSATRSTSAFWALKDLDFTIPEGGRVGIVGRNGAGKSTLLKVLSRIVDPTEGRITIRGRLASLLEVGTGFHPELSGRENIFLNGAILGMSRAEINAKFDEIVAFAEVEKFLDTPVKRYSSGMYVRLAFAVAAHLEPEILIVDEVLAVGDAEFQRKSLGKMKEVSEGGRTVLFVSHNMAAIQNLCTSAIYLKHGRLVEQGTTDAVIATYVRDGAQGASVDLATRPDRQGNGAVRFTRFCLRDAQGNELVAGASGTHVVLSFDFQAEQAPLRNLHVAVGIDNEMGQRIAHLSNLTTDEIFPVVEGERRVSIHIPRCPLARGRYTFTLYSTVAGEMSDYIFNAGTFEIEGGDFYGTGRMPESDQGNFLVDHRFSLDRA